MAKVLHMQNDWRLSVGLGSSEPGEDMVPLYAVDQVDGVRWLPVHRCASLASLKRWVAVVAFDPPQGLVDLLPSLPAYPGEALNGHGSTSDALPPDAAEFRVFGGSGRPADKPSKVDWAAVVQTDRPQFRMADDNYHGVLYRSPHGRLAVSPNGRKYVWQQVGASGDWVVRFWGLSMSALIERLPLDNHDWFAALPDDPGAVERPWEWEMAEGARLYLQANPRKEEYAGVIVTHGTVRLVVSPLADKYLFQTYSHREKAWTPSRWCNTAAHVRYAVVPGAKPWPFLRGVAFRSDRIAAVARKLPECPWDALTDGQKAHPVFVAAKPPKCR